MGQEPTPHTQLSVSPTGVSPPSLFIYNQTDGSFSLSVTGIFHENIHTHTDAKNWIVFFFKRGIYLIKQSYIVERETTAPRVFLDDVQVFETRKDLQLSKFDLFF